METAPHGYLRARISGVARLLRARSYLLEVGWFESRRRKDSVDAAGAPIPLISYPALDFLARRITAEMAVFEYGSGNSTLWWGARVRRVVACEHDAAWFQRVRTAAPDNVSVLHVPLTAAGRYASQVLAYPGEFDLVAIDGRERVACARNAPTGLSAGGVILWDDSDRARYAAGVEFLREQGFRQLPFVGMAPVSGRRKETSLFYRDGNCLGL